MDYGLVELTLAANEAVTFDAGDQETGNVDIGLSRPPAQEAAIGV